MILHRTPLVALLALPNSNLREEKMNSCLSCKNRLMYPFVDGISVSLICIPLSKAQDSDSTKKTDIPDSRIPIPLHGVIKEVIVQNCKWLIAMKINKTDGNLPKHNLQTRTYLLGWLLHKSLIECF